VINRTARVMGTAWGGQIVLTHEVKQTAKLPEGAILQDLGAHLLKDLCEPQQLLGLVHPGMSIREFPPPRSLSSCPNNLPIQTTPFLGREEELGKITELLKNPSCRLVTLIGPGGIGKTRLALQAAAEEIERFTHGVYFIALDPLSSADFLVAAIAEALKFSFYSREDEKLQLLNFLREKALLLILDNFEHLVAGAGMLSELLHAAPDVKILVTSRELLNLRGEWIVQIGGMDVPDGERIDVEGFSAVQLFFHNAQRIHSGVEFSDEDKRYVVRICQLVGGLPLGIEIASSWLRSLSCREIAQEMEKNIDFLATTMRDIPERHRSLRAVFDYSWDLLQEREREVMRKLSVFLGGFSRAAAEFVSGTSLSVLASLVDKSLLRHHVSGRYEMLDVLRKYVLEKLGKRTEEKGQVFDLYCQYYADFLDGQTSELFKGKEKEVVEKIREESENVRAAWNYAVEHRKLQEIDKLLHSFSVFHDIQGQFQEGKKALERAEEILKTVSEESNEYLIYGKVLARIGNFNARMGSYKEAEALLEKSIHISKKFDEKREMAQSLMTLGRMHALLGDYEKAKKYCNESLQINRSIDNKIGISSSLNALGVIHYYVGEYDDAQKLLLENLTLSEQIGYLKGISSSFTNTGLVAYQLDRYDEAEELLKKSLELDKKVGDKMGIANILNNLGLVYKMKDDFENAKKYYSEALDIRREIGDRMGISIALNNLGNLGGRALSFDDALAYHQEALSVRRDIGDKVGVSQSLNNLANVLDAAGRHREAKESYYEALMTAVDTGEGFIIQESLVGISESLIKEKKLKQSMRILVFLQGYRKADEDLQQRIKELIDKLEPDLPPHDITEIQNEVRDKTLDDIVGEIIGQLME